MAWQLLDGLTWNRCSCLPQDELWWLYLSTNFSSNSIIRWKFGSTFAATQRRMSWQGAELTNHVQITCVVANDKIVSAVKTFKSCKILYVSITHHCAAFCHLITLYMHSSSTPTGLPWIVLRISVRSCVTKRCSKMENMAITIPAKHQHDTLAFRSEHCCL